MRMLLHILLPLLTPLILYAIWAAVDAKRQGKGLPSWDEGHWFWVTALGCVLAIASLIYLTTFGEEVGAEYQSPRLENGRVVPGQFNK